MSLGSLVICCTRSCSDWFAKLNIILSSQADSVYGPRNPGREEVWSLGWSHTLGARWSFTFFPCMLLLDLARLFSMVFDQGRESKRKVRGPRWKKKHSFRIQRFPKVWVAVFLTRFSRSVLAYCFLLDNGNRGKQGPAPRSFVLESECELSPSKQQTPSLWALYYSLTKSM